MVNLSRMYQVMVRICMEEEEEGCSQCMVGMEELLNINHHNMVRISLATMVEACLLNKVDMIRCQAMVKLEGLVVHSPRV